MLRYWETEFHQLSPKKNNAGNRKYRKSDIEVIKQIKDLLYIEKYTIEGARQCLKKQNITKNSNEDSSKQILSEVQSELNDIIDLINKIK